MELKRSFPFSEEFELQKTDISGILKTFPIPKNLEKYYEQKLHISSSR